MAETTRTFIAIPIPEPVGQTILHLQAELSPKVPGCRWSTSLPFHLTLAFLGEVPNRDLNELCLAVASVVEPFAPFEVHLEGLGAFPSLKKPRVIWAGLTTPNSDRLKELRESVVRAATHAGHRPDDPRFHPHVTLGRIKSDPHGGCDLTELVQPDRAVSRGTFAVVDVVTFASTLGPRGASYAALGHAPLRGKKPESSP
jgi:2'-5' RNA ligase